MALNIKSPETERLAREVAALTGESITEAVRKGLELRLAEAIAERQATAARKLAAIRDIQEQVRAKLGGQTLEPIPKSVYDEMWGEADDESKG
jgi:antitoxin VapB